jgi:hypothetical protein
MRESRMRKLIIAAVAAAGMSAGCASLWHSSAKNKSNAKAMTVQIDPSRQVELPSPSATREGNTLHVAGVVKRRSGFDAPVAGHIHVDVLSADGAVLLDQILLHWTPGNIPTDGERQARYQVTYVAEKLPADARVRVAVVDDEYEHAFPAPSGAGENGGGGGGGAPTAGIGGHTPSVSGAPHGVGVPSVLGTPRTGRAHSTPSTPRQHNSSPHTPGGSHGRM